jgi:hypothetical protein
MAHEVEESGLQPCVPHLVGAKVVGQSIGTKRSRLVVETEELRFNPAYILEG